MSIRRAGTLYDDLIHDTVLVFLTQISTFNKPTELLITSDHTYDLASFGNSLFLHTSLSFKIAFFTALMKYDTHFMYMFCLTVK